MRLCADPCREIEPRRLLLPPPRTGGSRFLVARFFSVSFFFFLFFFFFFFRYHWLAIISSIWASMGPVALSGCLPSRRAGAHPPAVSRPPAPRGLAMNGDKSAVLQTLHASTLIWNRLPAFPIIVLRADSLLWISAVFNSGSKPPWTPWIVISFW